MTNFADELKKAVNIKARAALITCANELNRASDKFTPVWKGRLQRSKRVRVEGNDVFAVTGDSKTEKYLTRQYYEPLRHRGDFSQGLKDLTALYKAGSTTRGGSSKRTEGGSNNPRRPAQKKRGSAVKPRVKPAEAAIKPRQTGRGEKYLYGRAYRQAIRDNKIHKMDAPEWYDRAARDPKIMADLAEIFVGRM